MPTTSARPTRSPARNSPARRCWSTSPVADPQSKGKEVDFQALAASAGLLGAPTSGNSGDTPINRLQLAQVLARMARAKGYGTQDGSAATSNLIDVPAYARTDVAVAVSLHLITPKSPTRLGVYALLERRQLAVDPGAIPGPARCRTFDTRDRIERCNPARIRGRKARGTSTVRARGRRLARPRRVACGRVRPRRPAGGTPPARGDPPTAPVRRASTGDVRERGTHEHRPFRRLSPRESSRSSPNWRPTTTSRGSRLTGRTTNRTCWSRRGRSRTRWPLA